MFQLIDKQYVEATHETLLTVEFDAAVLPEARKKALKKLSREVKLPGFRPGRVPESVLVRRLGEQYIQEAIVDVLLDETYRSIIEKAEIEPYWGAEALVDVIETQPFRLRIQVELAPVVEIGDYNSIRVPYPELEVTEEEIDRQITALRERMALIEPVDRPLQWGDAVELEMLEVLQGEDVVFHQHDVRLLLNETSGLPEEAAKAMVGMTVGETREFDVVIPEGDTSAFSKLVGETLHFKVKVAQINSYTLPEADDAFASTLGPFTSLEEVRRVIEHELWHHKEDEAEQAYSKAVVDAVMAISNVRIPPTMVTNVLNDHIEKLRKEMREKQNITLEEVLRVQGLTVEKYMETMRPSVQRDIARYLVLREIYEREHLDDEGFEWMDVEEEEGVEAEDALYVELPEVTESLEAEAETDEEAAELEEEAWDEDEEAWEEEDEEEDDWYSITLNYLMDIASQEEDEESA